jgi:hypothetical protein
MSTQPETRAYRRVPRPQLPPEGFLKSVPAPELSVIACSLCLRVRRDGTWIEAEEAIRELRSYEFSAPLPLEPGLCDECHDRVRARRAA